MAAILERLPEHRLWLPSNLVKLLVQSLSLTQDTTPRPIAAEMNPGITASYPLDSDFIANADEATAGRTFPHELCLANSHLITPSTTTAIKTSTPMMARAQSRTIQSSCPNLDTPTFIAYPLI
jgi:hypothetical protein